MSFEIQPLTSAIGAEISGVDLRHPLSDRELGEISKALLDHHALFFRDQPITPQEQVDLARHFGPIDIHPFGRHLPDHPSVGLLDQTDPARDGANRWHADSTFMPKPPRLAVLHAVELPSCGGDTSWASMVAAYEMLSPALQRCLEGLTAAHDISGPLIRAIEGGHSVGGLEETCAAWPVRSHPVVCRHPETGRKLLDLMGELEDHDDVQSVYSNFDLPEALLVKVS